MPLSTRYTSALALTLDLHKNQKRKGSKIPYISHLLSVSALVMEYGGDEDEAIAGLLHDAVEDQGGRKTLDRIHSQFGDRVAMIVEACSDSLSFIKPPWRLRKERFIASIVTADHSVLLVTAADKLHNIRSLLLDFRVQGDALWSCFQGRKEGTLWYYRSVADALKKADSSPITGELDRAISELEQIARSGNAANTSINPGTRDNHG